MTALLIALDMALILVAARLMGGVFARLGQPAVIGEILTGFLLGLSVLGALPGDPSAALFPEDVRPALKAIGNLGLAIFMCCGYGMATKRGSDRPRLTLTDPPSRKLDSAKTWLAYGEFGSIRREP